MDIYLTPVTTTCGVFLDEFTFRFNRCKSRSRGKLFYRLLEQAVAVEPVPYKPEDGCPAVSTDSPSTPDESTAEAIGDWHYWLSRGYCL